MEAKQLTKKEQLYPLYSGSAYTIIGCGGDLHEWITGLTKMLKEQEIGEPKKWYTFNGALVNDYACEIPCKDDRFQSDIIFLAFPLDGLNLGKLAMFKLQMQDRWFDDIVDNMRSQGEDEDDNEDEEDEEDE